MEKTFHMLVYRAFHAQRNYLRGCLGKVGLGSGQPKLLGYLAQNGPSCQRQIADYFEIDPAAVSRMLDSLCKSGFVSRRVDEKNRRADVLEDVYKRQRLSSPEAPQAASIPSDTTAASVSAAARRIRFIRFPLLIISIMLVAPTGARGDCIDLLFYRPPPERRQNSSAHQMFARYR